MPISDAEYEKLYGGNPDEGLTETPGVKAGWGTKFGAAVDSAQAGLYGIGEAAGLDLGDRRRANQVQADANRRVADDRLGVPGSHEDVNSVGSALKYVGGLAVDTAPLMAGMAAGGLVAGPAGAAAVGYTGAVGDILQNQREQSGTTDGAAAALYGIPYAAVDSMTGVGGAVARRGLVRSGINALDRAGGATGAALRTGATVGRTAAVEGAGETFQEVMNQAGRMAVDPNAAIDSPEAMERYKESFVGGAALGGAFGGTMGGWRRSEGYVPKPSIDETGGKDLLSGDAPRLAFNPLAGTPTVFPDGTVALGSEQELAYRFGTPMPEGTPAAPAIEPAADPAAPIREIVEAQNAQAAPAEVDPAQQAAQERIEAIKTQAAETAEQHIARTKRAEEFGLKGTAAVDTFGQLEEALASGLIKDNEFAENVGLLAARKGGQVKKFLAGKAEVRAAIDTNDAETTAATLAAVQKPTTKEAPADATTSANPGTQASPTPGAQAAPQAAAGEGPAPGQRLIDGLEKHSGKRFTPIAKQRLYLWAGLDKDGFPATGKRTLDEVAAIEADRSGGGKAKSKQAIAKMLAALNVNEALVDGFISRLGGPGIENNGVLDTNEDADGDLSLAQTAEDSTPAESDEVSFGAAAGDVAEGGNVGMRSAASPNSSGIVDPEGDRAVRVRKELRRLAAAKDYSQAQRAEFTRVAAIKDDAERSAAAEKLAGNAELFSEPQRAVLDTLFESSRSASAAEGKTAAVAEQREIDEGPSPELVARNAEIIERNRQMALELQKLDGASAGTSLEMALPADMHNDIDDAAQEWAEDLIEGDPTWSQLTVKEQASWVKAYASNMDGKLTASQFARRYEGLKDEAQQRLQARSPAQEAGGTAARPTAGAGERVPGAGARSTAAPARSEESAPAAPQAVADRPSEPAAANDEVVDRETLEQQNLARQRAEGQFSVAPEAAKSTAASIRAEISGLVPHMSQRVVILDSLAGLPADIRKSVESNAPAGKTVQGFVRGTKVYLFADGIAPGRARAVFMHEVGSHLGVDLVFGELQEELADKVRDWSVANDGSTESTLAQKAVARVANAQTPDEDVDSELIAYFLEEATLAGIDPTAAKYKSELDRWLSTLKRVMKAALNRFIDTGELSAQDMVDIAYGAINKINEIDEDAGNAPIKFSVADNPRIPRQVREAQSEIGRTIANMAKQGVRWGAFTEDLARMAASVLPSVTKYVDLMREGVVLKTRQERNIEKIIDQYAALPAHERGTGPQSVNGFLRDSTMQKAWGYVPEFHDGIEVDEAMATRFAGMSAKAQQIIRSVFKHGHESLQEMKAAVLDNVTSEHDAIIAEAEASGDAEVLAAARAAKAKGLKDYQSMMAVYGGNWPYAPLKRFGSHVVVGMSQAYLDAEAARNTALMRDLQADEAHYYVEFAETRREAQKLKEGLAGRYAYADNFEKDGVHDKLYGGRDTLGAFRRLRALVEDSADDGLAKSTNAALNRLMNDLYLTLLSESSARQSERNRLNVAGADKDMMRAFATQGRATANFISSLRNNGKVQDALQDMKKEADARTPGREQRRDYYNEMLRRHVMGMDWEPTPVIDKAMSATSTWMLLTSPAYVLTNLTQPLVMSLPVMAGRHGYMKASAAMMKAYRELAPMLAANKGKFTEDDYAKLPADVREAVNMLANRGRIDISLEQDLGRWKSTDDSKLRHLTRATEWLRGVTSTAESLNRLVTAIAAVRLERTQTNDVSRQVAYAERVIYDTHGDYSGFNSPRIMRKGIGRLATQFRKFQLIQISMYAKLLKGSYEEIFKGTGKDERWVASKALAFSLGHMFALGGALGMPGAQAIGWVLRQIFGDDDEPDNPELTMRNMIGNKELADLLLKGAPKLAGLDLSGRLGAGGMLSLMPYADLDMSKKGVEGLIVQAMGPFVGGLLPKWGEGVGLMGQGDYYKGLEQMLPKGFADLMKGGRFLTDGMTQKNGDVVLTTDEVSLLDGFAQAMGLPTNTLSDRSFRSSAKFTSDTFYNQRTSQVKKAYTQAYRSGDTEAMAEARDAWKDLQASRQRNGYAAKPLADLLKAPKEQQKRERSTAGGVQYKRDNEGFVRRLIEE